MQTGEGALKSIAFFVALLFTGNALAQSTPDQAQPGSGPMTLAAGLLEHDFVNFYAFGNGVYDDDNFGSGAITSFGEEVGGGITAAHAFRDGSLSLSYSGGYRNY
ncbi:MAG: hypothetical protein WB992_23625, partial [Bryobacteraceae bacterium]